MWCLLAHAEHDEHQHLPRQLRRLNAKVLRGVVPARRAWQCVSGLPARSTCRWGFILSKPATASSVLLHRLCRWQHWPARPNVCCNVLVDRVFPRDKTKHSCFRCAIPVCNLQNVQIISITFSQVTTHSGENSTERKPQQPGLARYHHDIWNHTSALQVRWPSTHRLFALFMV